MSARAFKSRSHRGSPVRLMVAVAVALVLGTGAYAFTASNTVPNSTAGSGVGTVSGYTVSSMHYTLNTSTPVNADSLTFNVSPAIPSTGGGKVLVQMGLTSGGPTGYSCTPNIAGNTVTCATTSPPLAIDKLVSVTVIAAQ